MSEAHSPGDDAIQSLREALRASPNNSALRLLLADTLLNHGHGGEAEKEFREGLAQWPNSLPMKLGLARAFFQQGTDEAQQAIHLGPDSLHRICSDDVACIPVFQSAFASEQIWSACAFA